MLELVLQFDACNELDRISDSGEYSGGGSSYRAPLTNLFAIRTLNQVRTAWSEVTPHAYQLKLSPVTNRLTRIDLFEYPVQVSTR